MPTHRRKIFSTQMIQFAKEANVPLRYMYDWCTDYRPDDGRFSSARPRYKILRVGPNCVVRIRHGEPRGEPARTAIELVKFRPPRAWHMDQIDESDLSSADYLLTRLGPQRTRIDLAAVERWTTREHPSRSEYLGVVNRYWDGLVKALESDFANGLPAKGP
ncbi:MAG: hypothetical protein ACREEC_10035 [Thermoplasmata archaeon]